MVARKTAAKKTAPAKKSASARSTASRSTTTAKKATAPASSTEQSPGEKIAQAILDGHLDGDLVRLDDALTKRVNTVTAAAKKAAAKPTAKKVSAPPRKPAITVEPTAGTTYVVASKFKPLAGAKVKFVRFKADSNGEKSVVEMMTDKPGSPKGKKVVIPTAALEANKATRRTAK